MIELKFKRKTGWDGPDLDRGAERRAADLSLKILKNLEQVFLQAYETQTSPDSRTSMAGSRFWMKKTGSSSPRERS